MVLRLLANVVGIAGLDNVPHDFSLLDAGYQSAVYGRDVEIHDGRFEFKSNYNWGYLRIIGQGKRIAKMMRK